MFPLLWYTGHSIHNFPFICSDVSLYFSVSAFYIVSVLPSYLPLLETSQLPLFLTFLSCTFKYVSTEIQSF